VIGAILQVPCHSHQCQQYAQALVQCKMDKLSMKSWPKQGSAQTCYSRVLVLHSAYDPTPDLTDHLFPAYHPITAEPKPPCALQYVRWQQQMQESSSKLFLNAASHFAQNNQIKWSERWCCRQPHSTMTHVANLNNAWKQ